MTPSTVKSMNQKFKKCSIYITLLFLSIFAGCVSIKKEGKSFVLELKAISPAATPGHAPSTATLYDMSTGQPTPLNNPPSQFKNETNLSWTAPTTNANDTPLHDLDGYKIYYYQTENSLGAKDRMRINVTKNVTSIIMYNLSSGKWCFQVTAYDTSDNESEFSNGVCENTP
jgi:hypothetical protein